MQPVTPKFLPVTWKPSGNHEVHFSLSLRIPIDDLVPKTRCCRNQHSMSFQIPSTSTEVYKNSFFPWTIRDWNDLPESPISSYELSDDSVSKITSLVRARDWFPPVTIPGKRLSLWRVTTQLFRFRFSLRNSRVKSFCLFQAYSQLK